MAMIINMRPADYDNVTGNPGTAVVTVNNPNSGFEIDNRPPQGPQARSWTTGSAAGTNWIAAVIIIALVALAIWLVIKKMK